MKEFSKKSTTLAVIVLLCFGVSVFPQSSAGVSENTSIAGTQNTAEHVDESTLPITSTPGTVGKKSSRESTFLILLRMIVVLALVIACIYLVIWLMKRGMRTGNNSDPFMRVVSSITISPGKTVQVITLLDHAYLIGVTDNAVNLIGEVTDKELVDAMNLYADKHENTNKPRSFNDILALFMPNGQKGKNGNIFGNSTSAAEELLKKQHDRLQHGE
jgi:flagellar protein FliO/FliZ